MICLMGIAVVEAVRSKMAEAGMVYSREALFEKPETIRDGWVIRDMGQAERVLEEMDDEQRKLMDIVQNLVIV